MKTASIFIEIEEAEHPSAIVRIATPAGTIEVLAEIFLVGDELRPKNVRIRGLRPGALNRSGLNAVAGKSLQETNAKTLAVEGAPRTTGARRGHRPRTFRFPR